MRWIANHSVTVCALAVLAGSAYAQTADLTVLVAPAGAGVTDPPVGGPYAKTQNEVVAISATASAGYVFDHWATTAGSGPAAPASPATTVTMDQTKTVIAVFRSTAPRTGEIRAFWAVVFQEGYKNKDQIDTMIAAAVAGHYNVIIAQMLAYQDAPAGYGSHGAHWNSHIVPKSAGITPPDFDPLAYLCEQAHANGIQVHAMSVPFRMTAPISAISYSGWPPINNPTLAAHPEWFSVEQANIGCITPKPLSANNIIVLDPGNPEVQEYLLSIMREWLTEYPVDGVHWDLEYVATGYYPTNINTPNSTLARFKRITGYTGTPDTNYAPWQDFRRRVNTEFIRRAHAEILSLSTPTRQIRQSASLIAYGDIETRFVDSEAYKEFSNWEEWTRLGYLDTAIPMNYDRDHDSAQKQYFRNAIPQEMIWKNGRELVPGLAIYLNYFSGSLDQIDYCRSLGTDGTAHYDYWYTAYNTVHDPTWYTDPVAVNSRFRTAVPVPSMPWRDPATSTEGTLYGRVTDATTGQPIDDAIVWIDALAPLRTDGNGYYAVGVVPAVTGGVAYTVRCNATGYAQQSRSAVVSPASVTTVNFELAPADTSPPNIFPSSLTVTGVTCTQATVNWETDEYSDSRVCFGTQPGDRPLEVADGNAVTAHSVTLRNLQPGVTYYFVVSSRDRFSNAAVSAELQFTTPAAPADFIIESRSGGLNFANYSESGSFSNSTAKSTAAGCSPVSLGSRYATTTSAKATYSFTPSLSGSYEVFATWGTSSNGSTQVTHTVSAGTGSAAVVLKTLVFDQNSAAGNQNQWKSLGVFALDAGTTYTVTQSLATGGARLMADAVKWTAGPVVAQAGPDRTVAGAWATLRVGGSPTAVGGTPPYSYAWTVTPSAGASFDLPNVANPTFIATAPGTYRICVTVTDAGAVQSTGCATISIVSIADLLTPTGITRVAGSGQGAQLGNGYNSLAFGDVNGDGYADAIIGSPNAGAGDPPTGIVSVVYGSSQLSGQGLVNVLAPPSGVKVTNITGNGGMFGAAVAAGDINGDGFDDIVIGAHQNISSSTQPGEAYVVYGQTDLSSKSVIAAGSPGTIRTTHIVGDKWTPRVALGASVAMGDLNADGYADVIVGAPLAGLPGRDASGIAYVLYGSPLATALTLVDLGNPAGTYGEARILGGRAGDQLGSALACGDVNGDGYDDLVLGAPGASPSNRVGAGTAFVTYGAVAVPPIIDLALPAGQSGETRILGPASADWYGRSVAAGDMNGDGYADVMVGGYGADPPAGLDIGAAAVVYGSASLGGKSVDLAAAPPAGVRVTKVLGEYAGDRFGWAVGAGDVNGDGLADLLCGAPLADPPLVAPLRVDAGKGYVEYGRAGLETLATIDLHAGPFGAYLFGAQAGDYLGSALSGGGDVNGDGVADLIVAAPQANTAAGSAYLVYGSEGTLAARVKRYDRAGTLPRHDFGPAVRCAIRFQGDSGTAGDTTVTLYRTREKVTSMPLDQIANVVWQVETNRGGDWTAEITLRYLAKELAGLSTASLALYRADTLNGDFQPVPEAIFDAARNTVTVSLANRPQSVFVIRAGRPWTVTPPAGDASLTVTAPAGCLTLPSALTFTVSANASLASSRLTVTRDANWIALDKAAIALSPTVKSETVTASFTGDVRLLGPGVHTCTLTFRDQANATIFETRTITFTAWACGWTVTERAPLVATGTVWTGPFTPAEFVFDVTNTGEAPATCSIQQDAAWIKSITTSCSGPIAAGGSCVVKATLDPVAASALGVGTYTCNVTFTMNCAVVTKQIVLTIACGPAPVVTAIAPPAAQEGTSTSVTVTGSNFVAGHTTVKLTRAGEPDRAATHVSVTDANTLTCTLNLVGAAWGRWNVVAAACAEGAPLANAFTVTCNVPAITSLAPANGAAGQVVHVTVYGEDFLADRTVVWLSMTGKADIMAQNILVGGRNQLTCDFDLPAATALGKWNLNVGTCAAASLPNAFTVEAPPPPPACSVKVTSIVPSFVQQGSTLTGVTITGGSFDPGAGKTTVKLRMAGQPDIIPTNVQVAADGTSLTCDVDPQTAAVGERSVVVSVTGCSDGILASAFWVTVPCQYCPIIALAGAISATQGQFVTGLTIPGTYFVPGGTNVKLTRAGEPDIVASNVNVAPDGNSLTADVNLATAAVGHWNVVVSTCAPAIAPDKFVVRPACNTPPQDVDGDGDVDMSDFLSFQTCFNGPNRPWGDPPAMPASCGCFDVDGDADLDVADFLVFQGCFNGPNRRPKCQ